MMKESLTSFFNRQIPEEDLLLNRTLHDVYNKALGECHTIRKQTAETFLKKNEKDNILAKSRSINYNLDHIRSKLFLASIPKQKTSNGDISSSKALKKKSKSVMFSHELWGNKHYQKVIEDSYLFPKENLRCGKQVSIQMKNLIKKYDQTCKKIRVSQPKRKFFIETINKSFKKINENAEKNNNFEVIEKNNNPPRSSFDKKESKSSFSLHEINKLEQKKSMDLKLQKIPIERGMKKINKNTKFKTTNDIPLMEEEIEEEKKPDTYIEDVVKNIEFFGKCEDSNLKQHSRKQFFLKLIQSNFEKNVSNGMQIEKDREIRSKLYETFQYAKHKRGANPFNMLIMPRKTEKKAGIAKEILEKTKKKTFEKTLHFMMPLAKSTSENKPSSFVIEQQPLKKHDHKRNSFESKKDLLMEENKESKMQKKKSKSEKKNNQGHFYKNQELKKVAEILINECEGIINDDIRLKRQIDVGLNLRELESFVGANAFYKEERILRDLKKFEMDSRKKIEQTKKGISENFLYK